MVWIILLIFACSFSTFIEAKKDYTEFPVGTYNFSSTLSCFNESDILPKARVELWDHDRLTSNDLLGKAPIITPPSDPSFGYFVFKDLVAEDTYLDSTVELFYKFFDVCFQGQSFQSPFVFEPKERKQFIIHSDHAEIYEKSRENHENIEFTKLHH
uniref:Uncharacterized protein n=1 Tax=Panagrolaimus sp. ES5 TaxID=591445 RepID=A0AC34F9F5_9BILA